MSMYPLPETISQWLSQQAQKQNLTLLQRSAEALSSQYRKQEPGHHKQTAQSTLAYLYHRLPATYAAVSAVLAELKNRAPDFEPESLLDLGAGPGTSTLAAFSQFPGLMRSHLVERESHMIQTGKALFQAAHITSGLSWNQASLLDVEYPAVDLAIVAYVWNELNAQQHDALIEKWQTSQIDTLVLIDPGTPRAYQGLMKLRKQMLASNWQLWAPCPHSQACPLAVDDWCHFSQRLQRSAWQRQLKQASLNYEDEKFSYLIFSRKPLPTGFDTRIIRHPHYGKGHVQFELCHSDGLQNLTVSKKQAEYKQARKADWGDIW